MIIAITVWLGVLTFLVFRMMRHYNRLTSGVTKTGLKDILENILTGQGDSKRRLRDLETSLERVTKDGRSHIQRIGIVRFNPFHDTGGSQSFTIALLDEGGSGIVMTSLYARAANRWYVKEVQGGKSATVGLSTEEEMAIKKARTL